MQQSLKLTFPGGAGDALAARLELPDGEPRAYALFAHCFTCSKDAAAATRVSRALCAHGFAVLRFDFTGLGSSEGDFANTDFASNVDDLAAAADYLRAKFRAPALLVGHSLGGAAVIAAAGRIPEARAIATIAAPSDASHLKSVLAPAFAGAGPDGVAAVELGGRRFAIRRSFLDDLDHNPLERRLAGARRALCVLHSPADAVVGIDHALRLFDAAPHPKSFVSLDDADHLLGRKRDALYAAGVLAAWAARYVDGPDEADDAPEPLDRGVVRATNAARTTTRIQAGPHALIADEPPEAGGDDRGPNPYDLLLAGLGACTAMTLRMYAERKGWPLEEVDVRLTHAREHDRDCRDCAEHERSIARIERTVKVAGALDAAQRERLLEIANRCPVHRTLTGRIEVETRLDPHVG